MRAVLRLLVMLGLVAGTLLSAPAAPPTAAAQGYFLAAWGAGAAGPLGTTACCATRASPTGVPVPGLIAAVAAANGGVVAVRPDGTVATWGPYLPPPYIPSLLPQQVPGLINVVAVAAGSQFVLALTGSGTVWSWGTGALGRPATTAADAMAPAPIPGLSHVVQIAAGGNNALAITRDGTLYSWGDNWTGEIGDGTRTDRPTPVLVTGLSHVISAATSGQNAVAVTRGGAVWAWGDDAAGAPSRPGIIQSTVPVPVPNVPQATQVVAGFSTGLALAQDGSVWAWGENSGDALATGHPSHDPNGSPPAPVTGLHDVTALASGLNRYMAIEQDGSVWTWAGGLGGPARQPGLQGAAAVAASPTQWLALVAEPPPDIPTPSPGPCTSTVRGSLVLSFYPSALLVDQPTGHVFVLDGGGEQSPDPASRVCTASLTMLDGRTGRVLSTVLLGKGSPSFGLSPMAVPDAGWLTQEDGHIVVAYQPSLPSQDTAGGVSIVDAATGKLLRSVQVGYQLYGVAADTATHRVFATLLADPGTHSQAATVASLAVVDGSGGIQTQTIPQVGTPVVNSGAGRLFVLADTASLAFDTRSGAMIRTVSYTGGSLSGVGLVGRSGRLFVAYGVSPHCCGPSLQLLNARNGKRISQLGTAGQYGPLVVDEPVGRVLVAQYGLSTPIRGVTEVRDATTGRIVKRLPFLIGPSTINARNGRVYAITGPDTVSVLDPRTWRVVARYHPGGTLAAIALDQSTNRAFVLSRSGQGVAGSQTVHAFCVARRCP
ncbi:MAG TPA: hypothetical protein VKX16_14230 [Chloroflexota bacterium]|nr:hypothetical protein [Chloroflexota bacterium]